MWRRVFIPIHARPAGQFTLLSAAARLSPCLWPLAVAADYSPTRSNGVCSNTDMLQVVAGILSRNGRILICRRKSEQDHPLKWEFPGGKVEVGESPEDALRRELEEELDIRAAVGAEMARYEYAYPGKRPILLIFLSVETFEGEPRNRIFHEIRWEEPEKLGEFDFLEGDLEFLKMLTARRD